MLIILFSKSEQNPPCHVDKVNSNATNSNQGMYPECLVNCTITKQSKVLSRAFAEKFSNESNSVYTFATSESLTSS